MPIRLFPIVKHLPSIKRLIAERDLLSAKVKRLEVAGTSVCDCLPVPPTHLRFRVTNDRSVDKFLGIGRTLLGDIKILAGKAGREFDSFDSILEWGCGCGRITRYLRGITATDIDPEAIAWCQDNLSSAATFDVNDPTPPLKYADASFDCVYAISVFTHLPEDLAFAWLAELRRILRPDGLLVTSVILEGDLHALVPEDKQAHEEFKQQGFYYTTQFKTEGLPSFYGITFHSRGYIESRWSKYFTLAVYHPQAINNHQCGLVLHPS